MAREQIDIPLMDTSASRGALERVSEQIDALTATARKALGIEYRKVNMDPAFESDGFFGRRDKAALNTVIAGMRAAFYAGFKRSDQPPPPDAKIEAAFQEWLHRD
jgi:hypothetical protein